MRLNPRYGTDPVIRIEGLIRDPAPPLLRQRARLASVLALLDDDQWATPSRCEGWSIQDVVTHLITTNQFWTISIASALRGSPTQYLSTFDPVATPAEMVAGMRTSTPAETLDQFVQTNDDLAEVVRELDEAAWATLAEAPPGHVEIRLVALHALWDAWIHERDVVLPLGFDAVEEPDEIIASLVYAAALGPAFLATTGSTREGTLAVVVREPDTEFIVEVGAAAVIRSGSPPVGSARLDGTGVQLLEALSFRAPLDPPPAADAQWMLTGLAEVFDVAV